MAIRRSEIKDKIYEYLTAALHMTVEGACGFLANLYAESQCLPDMVEGLLIQRLSEDGEGSWKRPVNNPYNMVCNNLAYTAMVNSGKITKEQFTNPRNKHYGYGLAQWTTEARKSRLWANTIDKGKTINDLDGQLETLAQELEGQFKGVLTVCQSAISASECAEFVLRKFEMPTITASIIRERKSYAKEFLELYKNFGKEKTMGYEIGKVIAVAEAELGYLEKKSNSNLDSKTANAGSKNYTKYWRDLKPSWNGLSWCDCFVSWCFMQAYGKDAADSLLCGGLMSFDCDQSASYYKAKKQWHTGKDVKAGDQIFFGKSSDYTHTGIVVSVSGSVITTIEGNTSGASGVVANGGGVCRKTYTIGNSKIMGYGRPAYGDQSKDIIETVKDGPLVDGSTTTSITIDGADSFDKTIAGTYTVPTALNMRAGAGTSKQIVTTLAKGVTVKNYGYYTTVNGIKWLLVQATIGGKKITGFCSGKYLTKV